MKVSSSDLSTFRENLARIGFENWLNRLKANSAIVAGGGALLPKQILVLEQMFGYFTTEKKSIMFLSAPPASGKTHVICLLAFDLAASGLETAIVVPSSELRHDFYEGLQKIVGSPPPSLAILTMQGFLNKREFYDIALLDEAHNIRSSFELNPRVHRMLEVGPLLPQIGSLIYDGKKQGVPQIKILDGEDKKLLLEIAMRSTGQKWLRDIYGSRSKWIAVISSSHAETQLHLLAANPEDRRVTARSATILISATPLSDSELELYCGIEPNEVCRYRVSSSDSPKSKCIYLSAHEKFNHQSAIDLVYSVLNSKSVRTLILANRPDTVRMWLQGLQNRGLGQRLIGIIGGEGQRARLTKYAEFMSKPDSILLTNSTVFWEGINIKLLKLLIITEPPNPRPNLIDIYNGRLRKLTDVIEGRMIQGMGRIGRDPRDGGICLILFPYRHDGVSQIDFQERISEITSLLDTA